MVKLVKKFQNGNKFPNQVGNQIPSKWTHQDSLYIDKLHEATNQRRLENNQQVQWNKEVAKATFPFQIGPGFLAILGNAFRQIYRDETGKTKSSQLFKEAEKMRQQTQWRDFNKK